MKNLSKILVGLLAIIGLAWASPAAAQCTLGDVTAILHSIIPFRNQLVRGLDTHMAGQLYGPIGGPCQYRLFAGPSLDSEETPPVQTFTERQYFLGGSNWFWDYVNVGLTREEAAQDIQLVEQHVYLMRTDDQYNYDLGELLNHEETLLVSAMRGAFIDGVGVSVGQQSGIIKKLPAGHYVSLYTFSYPGNPELIALHPDDPDWVALFSAYEGTSVVNLNIVP